MRRRRDGPSSTEAWISERKGSDGLVADDMSDLTQVRQQALISELRCLMDGWGPRAVRVALARMDDDGSVRKAPVATDFQRVTATQHDCDVDDRDGDYGLVADVIVECFNPRDGDDGEESLLIDAIYQARDFIASIPCTCPADAITFEASPCGRCVAIGEVFGVVLDR
jgi:hypothetical protein